MTIDMWLVVIDAFVLGTCFGVLLVGLLTYRENNR